MFLGAGGGEGEGRHGKGRGVHALLLFMFKIGMIIYEQSHSVDIVGKNGDFCLESLSLSDTKNQFFCLRVG